MYSTGSPAAAPPCKNCMPNVVLPEPGTPSMRYSRCGVSPPPSTSSSPGMPVEANDLPDGSDGILGDAAQGWCLGSVANLNTSWGLISLGQRFRSVVRLTGMDQRCPSGSVASEPFGADCSPANEA